MPIFFRQATASQEVPLGYFVDSTDGNTEETALSIANTDIKIWKAGATTLANKNSGGGTHISNGVYYAVLDATDTDTAGSLVIFCHMSGALVTRTECVVLPAKVYDSLIAGSDNLEVDAVQWLGTACATPTVAGVPEVDLTHITGTAVSTTTAQLGVNVVQISADATAADNAEAFFDGTGYAGTNNVIPTVTTVNGLAANVITAASIAADAGVEVAAAVWDRVLTGATHNIASSAGRRLRLIDAAFEVHAGTAQAGTANTITLDTGASTIDNIYNGDRVVITAGTGAGEHGIIFDYDGASRVATMSKNWVVTPDNTSEFEIIPADAAVEMWNSAIVTGDGDWAELQTDVDAILVDTAEIGAAGAGLTALATQASVNTIDDFLDTEINTLLTELAKVPKSDSNVTWNSTALASVLTQVNAGLDTAIAELGVAAPTATPTLRTGIMLMYMMTRNKLVTQTSGTDALEVYNDAGTKIASKLLTDDGSDYTEAKMT